MKRLLLILVVPLFLVNTFGAFACKTSSGNFAPRNQPTEIKLAEIGLHVNFTINEGAKTLTTLWEKKIIKDNVYRVALDKVSQSQAIADTLNKNLDTIADIDLVNKGQVINYIGQASRDFGALLEQPDIQALSATDRQPIIDGLKGIGGVLQIASGVVSLIDKPTKKEAVKVAISGLNFAVAPSK